jgi:TPR repeat protein
MSDEFHLQVVPNDENSSLSLLTPRSGLIARGRRDAEAIARRASERVDKLPETRRRAEEGDTNAQCALATAYRYGTGVPQDFAEALRWYRKAADAGSRNAAGWIGYFYYYGVGVAQDYAEAVKWLRKDTPTEFGQAEFCLGKCYFYGLGVLEDYAEAARWLLEATHTSDEPFCVYFSANLQFEEGNEVGYLLSRIYSRDEVVKQWRGYAQDTLEWQQYVEQTKRDRLYAEAGEVGNQFLLGLAYTYGIGVPRDFTAAATWFQRAADAGEVWSQLHIAVAYARGRGLKQDYVKAHVWLSVVVSKTSGDQQQFASDARDEVARNMTYHQIAEAQRLASEWKPTGMKE